MNCRNGAYLGRTLIPWNFSEGSSYNATAVLNKIRCIKDKHHMQSKYVTWYGHHHLVLLISIIEATSWSPSSPARHTTKNTLPWWYVFVTVGHVFCHASTSMTILWQNHDSLCCRRSFPLHYQNYHHGSVHFHDDKSRVIEVLSSRVTDTWHPP